MSIVVSRTLSIFIPNWELIITYPKFSKTTPSNIVNKVDDFKEVTKNILLPLLEKLTELSISFKFIDLKIKQDAEVELWKYVVIKIELDVKEEIFDKVCDLLYYWYIFESESKRCYKSVTRVWTCLILLIFFV